jgi:hypothetical protein
MMVTLDERLSDSPYVEAVSQGCTLEDGSTIRPAEANWHMVLSHYQGNTQLMVVGPLSTSGVAAWQAGAEIIWIRFRLGVFMPHLPLKHFVDVEQALPAASSQRFWLNGSALQFPHYENIELFVDRLVAEEVLVSDPLIGAVLQEKMHTGSLYTGSLPPASIHALSPRTVRHRFLQATGLAHNHVRQIERAQRAAMLLKQGVSILDTVYDLGYYDQPHLTRSLKQWVGYTPAQLFRSTVDCHFIQDPALWPDYNSVVQGAAEL